MNTAAEKNTLNFLHYPPLGQEDWRYVYATARVRALHDRMLSQARLNEMADAASFEETMELLSGNDYAISSAERSFAEIEKVLHEKRSAVRDLFEHLVIDKDLVKLLRARIDFTNLRLAVRRLVKDKPISDDYSHQGNIDPEEFQEILEQENYERFPDYLQEAVERAVLGYYENKDIRDIDYALDRMQFECFLDEAHRLNSVFLKELFRMWIDLTNIKTMLRLRFLEAGPQDVFIEGGYIGQQRLRHGLDIGYEAIPGLFYATPYHEAVELGVHYLSANDSFLKLEYETERHINGYLRSTEAISAGPQPMVAYLLLSEDEIRKVRLVLTAKKNGLDKSLIRDRITRR